MKKFFFLASLSLGITGISYAQSPCAQAYEPNNAMSAAYAVNIGTSYQAAIAVAGDIDYYKITVPAGDYTIDLTNLSHDIDLQLLDVNGAMLAASALGSNSNEKIVRTLAAGTYYCKVYPYSGYNANNCYTLNVSRNIPVCAQAYEPNNTMSAAYAVNIGTSYQAAIAAAGDIDYYKITIPAGDYVVELTNLSHDIDLQLLDANGTIVSYSVNASNSNEQIARPLAAGTYYFKVYPYTGYDPYSCYTFKISQKIVSSSCGQSYEPNNTTATAFTITTGTGYQGAIGASGDVDYYKITVPAGVYTFDLTNTGFDADIQLLDVNGTLIDYSVNSGYVADKVFGYLAAGTYYVKVYSFGAYDANACYTLKATVNAPAAPCALANEPNNSAATATLVNLGVEYQGSIATKGDGDYYKVWAPAGTYQATLTNLTYNGTLSRLVYMFDGSEGGGCGTSNNPGLSNEAMTFSTGEGFLMFKVASVGASAEFDPYHCYTFKITQVGQYATSSFSATANANRTAVGIDPAVNAEAMAVYPNPAHNVLTVKLDKQTGKNAQIRVIDLAGKEVIRMAGTEGTNTIDISSLATGSYLISVENSVSKMHKKFIKK